MISHVCDRFIIICLIIIEKTKYSIHILMHTYIPAGQFPSILYLLLPRLIYLLSYSIFPYGLQHIGLQPASLLFPIYILFFFSRKPTSINSNSYFTTHYHVLYQSHQCNQSTWSIIDIITSPTMMISVLKLFEKKYYLSYFTGKLLIILYNLNRCADLISYFEKRILISLLRNRIKLVVNT